MFTGLRGGRPFEPLVTHNTWYSHGVRYDERDLRALMRVAASFGAEGYNRVWINRQTDWMYLHQHVAEQRMVELATRFPQSEDLLRRALNQAARELLLAQSSDWAFIITTGTMVQYAVKRFKDHIHRFTRLYEMISSHEIDETWLRDVESKDTIFQEIDYHVYHPRQEG